MPFSATGKRGRAFIINEAHGLPARRPAGCSESPSASGPHVAFIFTDRRITQTPAYSHVWNML